jgi:hypothetical protein
VSPRLADTEFAGDERFAILDRIGAGGMGVVYKALDKERGSQVALKTLRAMAPASLYRLKQEFRALADMTHPNLVALHELVQSGAHWFLTMEYVEGTNFLAHVRAGGELAFGETVTSGPAATPEDASASSSASPEQPHGTDGALPDVARLRAAFAQLAVGVAALHAAGKLHRDIKPSNVLVTPAGRVVLLDFGLVTELRPHEGGDDPLVGTAGYMAPEQAQGGALDTASDWYAVGVMLYEALTGRRPFLGPPLEVLRDKQRRDPVPARELASGIPADLDRLCQRLLARDPAARPSGKELLAALGVDAPTTPRSWGKADDLPLVGRAAELGVLEHAFERTRAGATVVAVVHGPSGIGKSRLVRSFLESLRGRALVLAGRCYERESVPFKAVDSLVDALCTHLLALPPTTVAALLPTDVGALVRVFPVLGRIEAMARRPAEGGDQPDPIELRQRAFAALRELCGRLAARTPLVLFVDDLQWGDADSGALLDALLAPPDAPPLLLVGCHRADEPARRPLLRTLLAPRAGVTHVDLELGPLADDEARELAARLGDGSEGAAAAVAREAGGSPFFVLQLAQLGAAPGGRGLDELLEARLSALSAEARALLAVIALAAVPIPQAVALAAAGLPVGDLGLAELEQLRAARLVRTDGAKGRDAVECYHDRIRDAAARAVDPATRRHLHLSLASALERDPTHAEALAEHFHEAGDTAQAAHFAALAAERAATTLAFDRAAELYRRALAWAPDGGDDEARRELHARLAEALVAAGRGAEAGRAFLAAAKGATPLVSRARRHRAAEQLMHSGLTDEGSAVLNEVLRELGLRVPETRSGAITMLLANRAAIALRGRRYRERRAEDVPAADLLRLDACWSAMSGFSVTSVLRATAFQARHARDAFRAGEPGHMAIAFAGEAFFHAHNRARAAGFTARSYELAERAADPSVPAIVRLLDGWRLIEIGSFAGAREKFAVAEQVLRSRCTGHAWARDTAQIFEGIVIYHQGHFGELRRHVAQIQREARVRGDLYLSDSVPYHIYLGDLAGDEPAALREAVRVATARGLPDELGIQHWGAVQALACTELYEGDPRAALALVEDMWPGLERSLLLIAAAFRREAITVRARVLVAMVLAGESRWERPAAKMIRKLKTDRTAATRALGLSLGACLARAQGKLAEATRGFAEAIAAFDEQGMIAQAAAARFRLGELEGGDVGQALVDMARATLLAESVRKPERFLRIFAPGPAA